MQFANLICSSFLEGLWFKGEDSNGKMPEREDDRWKILEPLGVPKFLANQLCTDLNGYFGCKSSVRTPPPGSDAAAELETLGTSSHTCSPSTATGSPHRLISAAPEQSLGFESSPRRS
jgi:hypothetical protein